MGAFTSPVSAGRKYPLGNQLPADRDGVGMVDRQHSDRRPPDGRQADQTRPTPPEMLRPEIAARMVEGHESARLAVDARDVGPLAPITSQAGQGEVSELRLSAVLAGDDVVDWEGPRIRRLREAAVLAASRRPLPNPPVEVHWHRHGNSGRQAGSLQRLAGLGLQDGQQVCHVDIFVKLVPLDDGEGALLPLRRKEVDATVM